MAQYEDIIRKYYYVNDVMKDYEKIIFDLSIIRNITNRFSLRHWCINT